MIRLGFLVHQPVFLPFSWDISVPAHQPGLSHILVAQPQGAQGQQKPQKLPLANCLLGCTASPRPTEPLSTLLYSALWPLWAISAGVLPPELPGAFYQWEEPAQSRESKDSEVSPPTLGPRPNESFCASAFPSAKWDKQEYLRPHKCSLNDLEQ